LTDIVSHSSETATLPAGAGERARLIPLDLIRPGPHQARKRFAPEALAELSQSIRESGVVQPVVVRSQGSHYELLAGERRWRAAQQAGLERIPAVIRDDLDDEHAFVLGLIENLQRESLSPMETAYGLKRLASLHQLSHGQLGQRIGKSREYVTHFLRLLRLEPAVQQAVDDGRVSLGHAKIMSGLPLPAQRGWLAQLLDAGWSVRAFERQVKRLRDAPRVDPGAETAGRKSADWLGLERRVADALGATVQIDAAPDGRGELRVQFHSLDALDGLLVRLGIHDPA
jgi:ParB family transcriptional regulator, chromosome partitioning protein